MPYRHKAAVFTAAVTLAMVAACRPHILGRNVTMKTVERPFSLNHSPEQVDRLTVRWKNGNISIRVDPQAAEISAKGTKLARAGTAAEAEALLEEIEIAFVASERDLRLEFSAPRPTGGKNYSADVELVVPASVPLEVNNGNGDLRTESYQADIQVNIGNGEMTLVETRGAVHANVGNGDIELDGQNGKVVASAGNGKVVLVSCGGGAKIEVGNGSVRVVSLQNPVEPIRCKVANGGVKLRLPKSAQAKLDLQTDNGKIETDLEGFAVSKLESKQRQILGVLNGGETDIEVRVGNGSIKFGPLPISEVAADDSPRELSTANPTETVAVD
jgi:DUF4097 and DUF4098 domain-containing protein YvlB